MFAKLPAAANLNFFAPHRSLDLFLLFYRWASLLLAMWLFLFATDVFVPGVTLSWLLALSLGTTLVITILHIPLNLKLLETPVFLAVDLVVAIILLTLSGATHSPYSLYALSPLLAGALFFHGRGAFLAVLSFTLLYPLVLLVARFSYPSIDLALDQLFTQLVQAWLVTLLFGALSAILHQLRHAHASLTTAHADLTHQNKELTATYRQLEVIHELTLFMHAPDRHSVQQRLLNAVEKEFDFQRCVIALANSNFKRLENWQSVPVSNAPYRTLPSLPLTPESGLIAQAVLNGQVLRSTPSQKLVDNDILTTWLGNEHWLILPLIWQEQAVGVLLVAGEVQHIDAQDDRWPILTSLVSQAAVAVGTILRTRRLAVEQERNRIARDIHDTVAQSLFGIVFTLDACTKLLPNQAESVKTELVELRNVADKVRQQVRQSVMDLWPTELTREQFKLDLDKYVKQWCPGTIFTVDYTINGEFDSLSPALRRGLYRVCQEALSNAAKHARTDSARVHLHVEREEVSLSIRDTGCGFDLEPVLAREYNREHFGIKGMFERIEALGGACDVLSQKGYGTQVLVSVPINGRNGHDAGR